MGSDLALLALGFSLGVSLAAPPGPILALCAQRTVRFGVPAGLAVPLGATTGDATHALLMGVGIFPLISQFPRTLAAINLFGAFLLLWFAWSAWKGAARADTFLETPVTRPPTPHLLLGGFSAGYMIALSSPYNFAWWLSVGTGLFRDYGALIFVGFFTGIVVFSGVFVVIVELARRRSGSVLRIISIASAVFLLALGLIVGRQAILGLFGS